MRILAFILTIFSLTAFGQNYDFYSQIIEDDLNYWDKSRDSIQLVLVKKSLDPEKSIEDLKGYYDAFYNSEKEISDSFFNYDQKLIQLFNKDETKELFLKLIENYTEQPTIVSDSLRLNTTSLEITNRVFDNFFKNGATKGWKKFHKKHRNSFGVYEFSRVEQSDKYAMFFYSHRLSGLFGAGQLVIMELKGNDWVISAIFNMWQA